MASTHLLHRPPPIRISVAGLQLALATCCIVAVCFPLRAAFAQTQSAEEEAEVKWHKSFMKMTKRSLGNLEELADVSWRRFADKMGFSPPHHIVTYSGYGNKEKVWIRGRLLANKPYGGPQEDDNWWDNLKATYTRWESDEIPDAEIKLIYGDYQQTVTTDGEGYYYAVFDCDANHPQTDTVIA